MAVASAGAHGLWRKGQRIVTVALVTALTAGAVARDYKQATRSIEDWGAAANTIAGKLRQDGCFLAAPPDQLDYYAFFRPFLRSRVCTAQRDSATIVTAMSPYTSPADEKRLLDVLPPGCIRSETVISGRIRIAVYTRR